MISVRNINGYHGDSAWTYPVGKITEEDQKLLRCHGRIACIKGLEEAKPGERLSNISHAIQTYVEAEWLFDRTRVCWSWNRARFT